MIDVPVSSVVTGVAPTVTPDTPTVEAAARLRDPEVPALVVREEGAVVGIVTESDVVAVVAEGGENPPVGSFMSAPVVTATPDTPIGLAADRMRDAGVACLPVVDEDGGYRGLVTESALAPYLSRHRLEIDWDSEPLSLGEVDAGDAGAADPRRDDAAE